MINYKYTLDKNHESSMFFERVRDVNFEQLKIFIAVVEYKSFTKAAASLYISHSTTSRNVAALEESLGVRLLERDNRSLSLTPAGELLFREGAKLLKKVDAIEQTVKSMSPHARGKIAVLTTNLYTEAVYDACDAFCCQYPGIQVDIALRDETQIWDAVYQKEVDMGVTFTYAFTQLRSNMEVYILDDAYCSDVALLWRKDNKNPSLQALRKIIQMHMKKE